MKDVNYQLDECPVQKILNLFQRKWNLRIIYELSKHESMRFGELKKAVLDISNTVLTSTLKALENQGLVLRQQFNEVPPHVEYSLTESAKALDNVMIGPNVTLATPMHPLLPEERNVRKKEDGSFYNLEYAKPITIKDNCWLASNVVVCGGVTIGEGCVIGAGSVVTRDIPPYSLAAGNPCRVIRKITEKDHMSDRIEKN